MALQSIIIQEGTYFLKNMHSANSMNSQIKTQLQFTFSNDDYCLLLFTLKLYQTMDQDFSNYLSSQKQFLAISEVQSFHPTMNAPSDFDFQQREVDSDFYDLYNYSTNVLKTWGLSPGVMGPSRENQKTVNCLMQLIRLRQKDLDYRQKIKQDLAKVQYDKETIKSKLNLAVNEVAQYKRKLGQLENKYKQEQIRFRKQIKSINSEKQQLTQVRQKLQQKNTQILHQLKKKQAQTNKIRDSIKKPTEKTQPKNSFEVISNPGVVQTQQSTKYSILKEKYQNERKYFLKQNSIMKDQLESAEDIINDFIRFLKQNWQSKALRQLDLFPNHLIEYNEGKLLQRLSETLQDVKNNLMQIIQQPSKMKISTPLNSKPSFKRGTLTTIPEPPPKMTQSVSYKTTKKQPDDDYFQRAMKEDISIISHIQVKDIEMPLKGKANYDKWDILYDGRL